jgi:hypothetical protein
MEEDVIGLLLATAPITALVADRVCPARRPQGSPMPVIVVTRISGAPEYADDGEIGLEAVRLQIDSWATTYTAAKQLGRLVRDRLSAFSGVYGATDFSYIMLDEERDLSEQGANQTDYPFRIAQDWIFHVRG